MRVSARSPWGMQRWLCGVMRCLYTGLGQGSLRADHGEKHGQKQKALTRKAFDGLCPPTPHLSFWKELGGYHTAPPKCPTFQGPPFRWVQAPQQCLSRCHKSPHLQSSQFPRGPLETHRCFKNPSLGLRWLPPGTTQSSVRSHSCLSGGFKDKQARSVTERRPAPWL